MEKHGLGLSHSPSVMILTIAVGVQDQPSAAPQTGTWVPDYNIIGNPTFTGAISSVSTLLFAFSGTPGFFAIIAEMRNPRQYTQAVLLCQSFVAAMFTVIGCVVYYYCGSYVASPALGSAGGTIKKNMLWACLARAGCDTDDCCTCNATEQGHALQAS